MKEDREQMVYQIKHKYGLNSPDVLSAMLQVSREEFVPKRFRSGAYRDSPIPVGFGQFISQPYTVAFMTDLLDLTGKEKVLEIGTGSGYQAAVLSILAKEVYSLEIIPQLAQSAENTLKRLKFNNVTVKHGSGEWGWPEVAPFDSILITAAIEKNVPQDLIDQLKTGGIIVAPIGPKDGQVMTKLTKMKNQTLKKEEFQKYVFVPFIEEKN